MTTTPAKKKSTAPLRAAPVYEPTVLEMPEKKISDLSWMEYCPGYPYKNEHGMEAKAEPLASFSAKDIAHAAILAMTVKLKEAARVEMFPGNPNFWYKTVYPVYGEGGVWRYQPELGLWQPIEDAHIETMIFRWEGSALVKVPRKLKKGEEPPPPTFERRKTGKRIVNDEGREEDLYETIEIPADPFEYVPLRYGGKNGCAASTVWREFLKIVQSDTQRDYNIPKGSDFFAEASSGMMFRDCFLFYDEDEKAIVKGERSFRWRQRVMFPYNAPDLYEDGTLEVPDHPLFRRYLSSIWKDRPDAADREQQLSEFLGIALLGLSTREPFNKAMFLHGPAGTGKSTFVEVAKSIFPKSAVSNVSPHKFGDDNHLLQLAYSRLNTVSEVEESPLGNHAKYKTIISGETVAVCGKYERAATLAPTAAHLFAANELPSVAGAHPSFWERVQVLCLDNVFRGKKGCELQIAKQIINREQRAVLAWALNGGLAALQRGGFTIAASSRAKLNEWKGGADNVGEWIEEGCKVLNHAAPPKEATPLKEAYAAYQSRCLTTGNKPCSQGEFARRLVNLGVKKEKSGQIKVWLVCYSQDEINARAYAADEAANQADMEEELEYPTVIAYRNDLAKGKTPSFLPDPAALEVIEKARLARAEQALRYWEAKRDAIKNGQASRV